MSIGQPAFDVEPYPALAKERASAKSQRLNPNLLRTMSSISSDRELSDLQLKTALSALWKEDPSTSSLGVPSLRALFRERTVWEISEKRLRRVRAEAMQEMEEQEDFGMLDKRQDFVSAGGIASTVHTQSGGLMDHGVMHINEKGEELQLHPMIGISIATGRKFKRGQAGEWVLAN